MTFDYFEENTEKKIYIFFKLVNNIINSMYSLPIF